MKFHTDRCVECGTPQRPVNFDASDNAWLNATGQFESTQFWFCSSECMAETVKNFTNMDYMEIEDKEEWRKAAKEAVREGLRKMSTRFSAENIRVWQEWNDANIKKSEAAKETTEEANARLSLREDSMLQPLSTRQFDADRCIQCGAVLGNTFVAIWDKNEGRSYYGLDENGKTYPSAPYSFCSDACFLKAIGRTRDNFSALHARLLEARYTSERIIGMSKELQWETWIEAAREQAQRFDRHYRAEKASRERAEVAKEQEKAQRTLQEEQARIDRLSQL